MVSNQEKVSDLSRNLLKDSSGKTQPSSWSFELVLEICRVQASTGEVGVQIWGIMWKWIQAVDNLLLTDKLDDVPGSLVPLAVQPCLVRVKLDHRPHVSVAHANLFGGEMMEKNMASKDHTTSFLAETSCSGWHYIASWNDLLWLRSCVFYPCFKSDVFLYSKAHQNYWHWFLAQCHKSGLGLRHVTDPPVGDDHDHGVVHLHQGGLAEIQCRVPTSDFLLAASSTT